MIGKFLEYAAQHVLAVAILVLGVLEVVDVNLLASLLPGNSGGWATIGLAVTLAFLRQVTTTRSKVPGLRPRREEYEGTTDQPARARK